MHAKSGFVQLSDWRVPELNPNTPGPRIKAPEEKRTTPRKMSIRPPRQGLWRLKEDRCTCDEHTFSIFQLKKQY